MVRPVCSECAMKHLAQASILLSESKRGYPYHYRYALGHMAEAEEELIGKYKKEAQEIRKERKKLESNPDYLPSFDNLIKMVDEYCEECELNVKHAHYKPPTSKVLHLIVNYPKDFRMAGEMEDLDLETATARINLHPLLKHNRKLHDVVLKHEIKEAECLYDVYPQCHELAKKGEPKGARKKVDDFLRKHTEVKHQ